MKSRTGFTLVEVLLVVLVLGVLASIVVPRVAESAANAKVTKCDANRSILIRALERYALNNDGTYPKEITNFSSDVFNSTLYFPHGVPTCPYGVSYDYDKTATTILAHSH